MEYLQECGVLYSHERIHPHDWRFRYTRKHVETGHEKAVDVFIHPGCARITAERDFYKLLDHWNRDERWRYNSNVYVTDLERNN